MRRIVLLITAALVTSFLLAASISADVPHLIRFQGKVTDKEGAPLNGAYNITFRIYDGETGGALLWSETQAAIPVNNGIFTVLLGNVSALDLPFDESYWLSMEVNDDGEMAPRQTISSVGYAIHAEVADSISGVEVVPQGAIIMCRNSCPAGYTRVADLDGKFIVAGATYNAEAGGSNTHNHGGTTGTAGEHTHTYSGQTGSSNMTYGCRPGDDGVTQWQHSHSYSGTTSTGGSHSHTITSADNRPEFATVILCEKN